MKWTSFFPMLEWIRQYRSSWWRQDTVAGLVVGIMLVPQGMAYAQLTGMPPIYGLYGALVPVVLYAIFGTSRQMNVGPVAISALLVFAGVSQLAEPFTPEYISLVILTGLLVGVLQFLIGAVRLGILVNFLSHPVIIGFTSAAAVIISVSQLRHVFGLTVAYGGDFTDQVATYIRVLPQLHPLTTGIGLGAVVIMLVFKRYLARIPGALVVTVVGTLLAWFFRLNELGVSIVGAVPAGLPAFAVPDLDTDKMVQLIPTVIAVTVICIVESISIAMLLQHRNNARTVRPDQELMALGISKIGGAFFQSLPTSGSFSRSAVNNEAGAQTPLSSLVTVVLVVATLLFLTPLFYYLPQAVLAAIILVSVAGLFGWREARHLWHVHRTDFYMLIATFLLTLMIGIEMGVLIGVILSVLVVMLRAARPHMALLGKLPDGRHYRNMSRFPLAQAVPGVTILRFDAPLYFINVQYFIDTITEILADKNPPTLLILDASSMIYIDGSGLEAVEQVLSILERSSVQFYLVGAIGPVRDSLERAKLSQRIGLDKQFLSIGAALDHWEGQVNHPTNSIQ